MNKNIISGVLVLVSVVSCVACSNSSNVQKETGETVAITSYGVTEHVETTEQVTVEADKETAESTAEATKAAAGNKETGKTLTVSDDWTDMEFLLGDVRLKIPFAYSELRDEAGFSFNIADYGYEDGYTMNPGDKVTSTINVINPDYGDGGYGTFKPSIGLKNYGDTAIDLTECDVWAVTADIRYAKQGYPELVLAKGITWGSTKDEVIAAYGEPDDIYTPDSLDYDTLSWEVYDKSVHTTYKMRLQIYRDELGLTMFELKVYD